MSRKEWFELQQLTQNDETMAWVDRKSTRANRRKNKFKYDREED